ncbi:MAG TPA: hypothetical protein PL027_09050 [Thermosynergistes sp.]|nr:hypothetical protein [Thermosynergistes sp.]
MEKESEKAYLRPRAPLVMSRKRQKVEAKNTGPVEESEPSAFRCVSVINLKKEDKKMFHTVDEILKEREEVRKRKEQTMRYMAGLSDKDQDNLNALSADDQELKKLEAMEASGKMMPAPAIERLHYLRSKKAGNSSVSKKSSSEDMLWLVRNSK